MRWGGVGVRWVREEKREPGRIVQYGGKEREPEKQSITTSICMLRYAVSPWTDVGMGRGGWVPLLVPLHLPPRDYLGHPSHFAEGRE